eukprot:gene5004-6953_t
MAETELLPLMRSNHDVDYNLATIRGVYENLSRRARQQLAFLAISDILICGTVWILAEHGFNGKWQSSRLVRSITDYTFQRSMLDLACVGAGRAAFLFVVFGFLRMSSGLVTLFATGNGLAYLMFLVQLLLPLLEAYFWLSAVKHVQHNTELLYNDGYREIVDPDNIHRCVLEQHITAPLSSTILRLQRKGYFPTLNERSRDRLVDYKNLQGNHDDFDDNDDVDDDGCREDLSDDGIPQERGYHRSSSFLTPASELDDVFYDAIGTPVQHTQSSSSRVPVRVPSSHAHSRDNYLNRLGDDVATIILNMTTRKKRELKWEKQEDRNGVTVSELKPKNQKGSKLFRCQGLVWSAPEVLFRFLYDDFDLLCKKSSLWSGMKIQRIVDKNTDLLYILFKKVPYYTQRDITVVRNYRHFDSASVISFSSVEDPLLQQRRNIVRAYDRGSGFCLQRVSAETNVTKLTFYLNVDFKETAWFFGDTFKKSIRYAMCSLLDEIRSALENRAGSEHQQTRHLFA